MIAAPLLACAAVRHPARLRWAVVTVGAAIMTCETLRELDEVPPVTRLESDEARYLRIRRRHSGAGRSCCDWCLLVERIERLEEHRIETERIIDRLEEP